MINPNIAVNTTLTQVFTPATVHSAAMIDADTMRRSSENMNFMRVIASY